MPIPARHARRARVLSFPLVVTVAALAFALGCEHPAVRVIALDAGRSPPAAPPAAPPRSWPVVVSIVVDQEAAWIADERWPLLPADGGFARLRREGTYARDMRYAHAATDTA